jgi:hypothetical protein
MFGAVAEFWRVPAAGRVGEGDRLGRSTGQALVMAWVPGAAGSGVLAGGLACAGWVPEQGG